MQFRTWLENLVPMTVPINKLFGWKPKADEVYEDIVANRLSQSSGLPKVSRLDNPRGSFFIIDGYHRIVEAGLRGQTMIPCQVDEYIPRIERAGGAHRDMVMNKVPIVDIIQKIKAL